MLSVKSPISRIGGKAYLTNWLCSFLPEHLCYVEPFAGGAKLLFAKDTSSVEILNDTDNELVNLYRIIQNEEKRQVLIKMLNETPYSRSEFYRFKDTLPQNEIEKAARYFYLCRNSFAGDIRRGGFAVPSTTGRNPAQSYYNAIDSIERIAGRFRGVTIECLDYADCIQKYDSETSLIYADPPYLLDDSRKARRYYGQDFTIEDHYRLSELLHDVKGKVMISHYSNSLYDDLYRGWQRYEYQSFKGSHKSTGESKPKTIECLWTTSEVKQKTLFSGMTKNEIVSAVV